MAIIRLTAHREDDPKEKLILLTNLDKYGRIGSQSFGYTIDFTEPEKYIRYPFILNPEHGILDFGGLWYQPENTDIHQKQVRKAKRFYRWMDQGNPTPDSVTYKIKKIEDTEKRTTKIFVRVFAKVPDEEWKMVILAPISKDSTIDKKLESFGYTTDFTFETNSFVKFPFVLIYNKGNPVFDFGGVAYSDASRPPIPIDSGRSFRSNPATL